MVDSSFFLLYPRKRSVKCQIKVKKKKKKKRNISIVRHRCNPGPAASAKKKNRKIKRKTEIKLHLQKIIAIVCIDQVQSRNRETVQSVTPILRVSLVTSYIIQISLITHTCLKHRLFND